MAVSPTSTLPGLGQRRRGQVGRRLDGHDGQVLLRRTADDPALQLLLVRGPHGHLVGALDHVVRGEDEALAVVDDAGARGPDRPRSARRPGRAPWPPARRSTASPGPSAGRRSAWSTSSPTRSPGVQTIPPTAPNERRDEAHSQPRPLARTGLTGAGNRRGLVGRRLLATGSRLGDQVVGIGRRQEVGHRRGRRQVPPGAPRGQHRGRVRISGRAHRHGWSPRMDGARRGARAVMAAKVRSAT